MAGPSQTLYATLGVHRSASQDEIRKVWRSLVLLYHPDKTASLDPAGISDREVRLLSVNRAWEILRDPASREAYDKSLMLTNSTSSSPGQREKTRPPPPLARTVLSLDLFTPHYSSSSAGGVESVAQASSNDDDDGDDDTEPTHYTHPCRCSALYTITTEQLEEGVDVIGCDGCGDWVRVGYEVLEESGEE